MVFIRWLSHLRELPWYILTRCGLLSCAMLLSAAAVQWSAGSLGPDTSLLWEYADYTRTMAVVVALAGFFAAACLEDILDKKGLEP